MADTEKAKATKAEDPKKEKVEEKAELVSKNHQINKSLHVFLPVIICLQ